VTHHPAAGVEDRDFDVGGPADGGTSCSPERFTSGGVEKVTFSAEKAVGVQERSSSDTRALMM
jgi:hypothetical protein